MPRRPIPKTPLALLLLALLLLALLLCDVALVLDHAGQPSDLRMMDLCLGTALGILLAVRRPVVPEEVGVKIRKLLRWLFGGAPTRRSPRATPPGKSPWPRAWSDY